MRRPPLHIYSSLLLPVALCVKIVHTVDAPAPAHTGANVKARAQTHAHIDLSIYILVNYANLYLVFHRINILPLLGGWQLEGSGSRRDSWLCIYLIADINPGTSF